MQDNPEGGELHPAEGVLWRTVPRGIKIYQQMPSKLRTKHI